MKQIFHIAVLILASSVPFLHGHSGEFIFDDVPAILENKDMVAESPSGVLHHDFWGGNLSSNSSHKSYRPLSSLTLWLEAGGRVDPTTAARMRYTNLAINSLVSVLLYLIFQRLLILCGVTAGLAGRLAFLSGVQHSLHPVHVEAVVALVGRADLLSALLLLLSSFILLLDTRHPGLQLTGATITAAAALFAKETGVVAFAFLVAILSIKYATKHRSGRQVLFSCFFLLTVGLLLALWRLRLGSWHAPRFARGDNPAAASTHQLTRLLTFNHIALLNLFLLICPTWLCFDWSMGCVPLVSRLSDPRLAGLIFIWSILLLMTYAALRAALSTGNYLVLAGLLLILAPQVLSLNVLVHVGFVVAERNLYLPAAGVALLVNIGRCRLAAYSGHHKSIQVVYAMSMAVLLARTVVRSRDWRSQAALFASGLSVCPGNAKVHYNIAKLMAADKEREELVLLLYKEAVRLEPDYEQALNNLGNMYRGKEELLPARALLERAVRVNNKFPAAFMNLGIVYQALGDLAAAEASYLHALKLRVPYADCEYNIGNLYLRQGQHQKAETHFRRAANLNQSLALSNLVILLDEQGRWKEAAELARSGTKKFPRQAEFRFHLANIFGKQGEHERSEAEYLAAIQLEAKAAYYANLGVLYHRWGKREKARVAYETALGLDPNLSSAQKNLKSLQRTR